MKDPVLAQQIEAAGAFIADWNALFERAAGARQAGPAAPGDAAAEFLAVRNALVQRYPELMTALEIPVHSDDEVMQLLGRLNSLAAAREQARRKTAAETAKTRVDFFTMVRGEDA